MDGVLTVALPRAVILALRGGRATRSTMTVRLLLPNGTTAAYDVPVLHAARYTLDDIFSRRLLLLLPFYIFRHERRFASCEGNPEA